MILALTLAALAGPPPADLNTDDPFGWDDEARKIVDGPPGCHDAEGLAKVTFTLYQMPDALSAAREHSWVFAGRVGGRLLDGTWSPMKAEDAGAELVPLFGKRTDAKWEIRSNGSSATLDGDDVPLNLVRRAVDVWGGSNETVYADWDPAKDGVVVHREVPVSEGSRDTSKVVAFFPGGGRLATQLDVLFPQVVRVGTWPARVKLQGAQLHLRQEIRDGAAWPTLETASLVVTVFGFVVGIEQTIQWQGWAACRG